MRDKDNWVEANRNRDHWGTKNYSPNLDFSHCMQAESTDKYGTVDEVFNAVCYFDIKLDDTPLVHNSISLLRRLQEGISDKRFEQTCFNKELDDRHGMRKPAKSQEIANMVHHYLDWLRATAKRKWDNRGLNSSRQMLDYCIKGYTVNKYNPLHYDESPER